MGFIPTKVIGNSVYVHADSLLDLDADTASRVRAAELLAGVNRCEHFNLVRIEASGSRISLLHYPYFFESPFPSLSESWLVDLDHSTVNYRTYAESLNPKFLCYPVAMRGEIISRASEGG